MVVARALPSEAPRPPGALPWLPRSRAARWNTAIALFAAALIAGIWIVTQMRVQFEHDAQVADTVKQNSNLALALEEHTVRTLRSVDQALVQITRKYREALPGSTIQQLVEDGTVDASVVRFMGLVDTRGTLLFGSAPFPPTRFADRDWFRAHVKRDTGAAFMNKPVRDRATGDWVIPMSRRLSWPDGSFAGVVYAELDPQYFASFYRRADLGEQGLVEIVGLDGVTRARRLRHETLVGRDMSRSTLFEELAKRPAGNYLSKGRLDGVPRFYSYRTLQQYPLVVGVATSREETLAELHQRERNYYAMAAGSTVVILAFSCALCAAIRRQARAMEALQESRDRFEQLASHIPEALWISDVSPSAARGSELVYVSPSLEKIWGRSVGALADLWRNWKRSIHPDDGDHVVRAYAAMREGRLDAEYRITRPDGAVRWVHARGFPVLDRNGEVCRVAGVLEDVTERKALEERLLYQAQHDALTGLPNRAVCFDRLSQALVQAQRRGWNVAILFIDLDRFKNVNDTLGHLVGDDLLRQAASRLAQCVRSEDVVARLGGDEFAVVLPELTRAGDASVVAQKILDALARPFDAAGRETFVTASVGIAGFPDDGADVQTLVKNADAAMFRAKSLGRNAYQFYTTGMNALALEKLELENRLRRAVERREFLLHFQLKTDAVTGAPAGVEALLRWRPLDNGLMTPDRFIGLLEDSGLIVPVGEWVLRTAAEQAREWQRGGMAVRIAVNLSAKQFQRPDLCATVARVLRESRVDPALLEVEITESAAMDSPEEAVKTLIELRRLGLRISIDDFGTGYSSLAYLKRLPLDSLKIDRSFITGLPDDADDISIARAVIAMAHSLNMKVVAEGVETEGQHAFLSANGCDEVQGYLISRPLAAEECAAAIRERARRTARPPEPAEGALLGIRRSRA